MFTYDNVFIIVACTMNQDVIIMDVRERNVHFNLPMGEKGELLLNITRTYNLDRLLYSIYFHRNYK